MTRSDEGVRGFTRLAWAAAVAVAAGVPAACSTGDPAAPSFTPLTLWLAEPVDSGEDGFGADAIASDFDSGAPAPATDPMDAADYDAPESYLAAESVVRTSCAFIRCHGGATRGGAGLWFGATQSIRGPLVNVPACEYDKMMRVKPGDVANSWVMSKLEAPQDPQTHALMFTPQPGSVPNLSCGQDPTDAGFPYGLRMPATTFQLDSDSIAKLVAWIEAGAPGPD
jgi:hypothetical protein